MIFSDSKSVLKSIDSNRLINSNYTLRSSVSSLSLAAGTSTSLLSGSRLIVIFRATKADKAAKEVTLEGRRDNLNLKELPSDLIWKPTKMSVSRFNKYFEDVSRTIG